MEVGGQERKTKQPAGYHNEKERSPSAKDDLRSKHSKSTRQQPQRINSLDSALDVSDKEIKQRERDKSSSRKSAPSRDVTVGCESARESSSSQGRIKKAVNGTARHTGESDDQSRRKSKRKSSRMPRLAHASSPPMPSTLSNCVLDGMEQHIKQKAANPASSDGDPGNNGRRRSPSPSPEESLSTRPGAHAVSLDGEEFRGSGHRPRKLLDGNEPRAISQSAAIDMSGRPLNENVEYYYDDETMDLQASIVDEENPEVAAIKAENKRLRQTMIAENRRRRQQIENNNQSDHLGHHDQTESTTVGEIIEATPAEETGDNAEEAKKRRRRLLGTFLCLLLAIAGAVGGVFAWHLTAKNASLKRLSDEPGASSPYSSSPPSSPPTITMLYDPPSEEDCLAVENGEAVSGQDTMIIVTLDVGLEIVLNKDIAQKEWMDQLLQSILAHLIPYLVGCTDDRNPSVGNRYVFGNGNATIDYDDEETCEEETDLPCYPVAVHLDLTVKDDEEVGSLISLLETLIGSDGSGGSLSDRLHLSDDFNEVVLEDITNKSPTASSSSAPTDMPISSYPSAVPSAVPSSLPSLSLSTPRPSLVPLVTPTTALPSSAPTDLPSESPSTRPSETPVAMPLFLPTKTPSATPTASPSALPSVRPSNVPSRRPSSVPSESPSTTPSFLPTTPLPSGVPSSAPSSSPSVSPSNSPTSSPQPSVSGFNWVTCGKYKLCAGRPATVQNWNYRYVGGIPSNLAADQIAVRCCSDTLEAVEGQGFYPPKSENCPYANSNIGGVCYKTATYYEAENVCTSVGARLCSLAEVEDNCVSGTGCSHNDRMIWTSTPGPMDATGPPVPPIPTNAPTTPPTTHCCSGNFMDCDRDPYCDVNQQQCTECNGHYIVQGSCPATKIAKWGDCTNNVDGCCEPLRCVAQDVNYRQCLE